MAKNLTEEQSAALTVACSNLVNKLVNNSKNATELTTIEQGVERGAKLAIAFFMLYGLLDIDNFIILDDVLSKLTPEEIKALHEECNK